MKALGGKLLRGNETDGFRGVSIDSRSIQPRELFFCIRGPHFDGHDFLEEVAKKNAGGVILSNKEKLPPFFLSKNKKESPFLILVEDTLKALQDLAHFHRESIPVRVVGITGTNGKSTTKEMTAAIAQMKFKTLKNAGNLNNHIGLPLTLLGLDPAHEVAILEMGMSGLGEIRRLAEIAEPQIGVITNIAEGHILQMKNLKQVQAAKGELFEALDSSDTAIVNADDPMVLELARSQRSRVITFGVDSPADVRAENIQSRGNTGYEFTVSLFDKEFPLHLPFLGIYNIYNALAAIAVAHVLGVPVESIPEGLKNCRTLSKRSEIVHHNSLTIINDAYNANPQSMNESLKILEQYQTNGRKFFVIGDMLELGNIAHASHMALGEEVARRPIDFLVTVGSLTELTGKSALDSGMENHQVKTTETHQEAVEFISQNARSGDCLLVKGSRGMQMEQVIEGLMKIKSTKED